MQTLIVTRSLNFYPRPPGGGRRTTLNSDTAAQRFLSTPSGWRATEVVSLRCTVVCISIHALRVEGDPKSRVVDTGWTDFYPRPPGGGRQCCPIASMLPSSFLSTPSGWRATEVVSLRCTVVCISIHALRVEGDPKSRVVDTGWTDFYPRPPGGGRQQKRTKFSSVFAQKGEEIASLRRGKRKFAGGVLKRTNFGF